MADRLTNIEILPEICAPAVLWLYDTIASRRMTQTDMLQAFNARLDRLGTEPVSRSGLNRYVQKVRAGEISRPKAVTAPVANASGILCPAFRAALVNSIHEPAVLALEAALAALAGEISIQKAIP